MSFLTVEILTVVLFFVLNANEKATTTKQAMLSTPTTLAEPLPAGEIPAIVPIIQESSPKVVPDGTVTDASKTSIQGEPHAVIGASN
jgi:hypothetical protein